MNRTELAALRDAIDMLLAWPECVREQMARWLAPEALKPNGDDPSPPVLTPPPRPAKARPAKPTPAQAAEQRLLAAMRDNPNSSVAALANAANASRSATGERLRRLSEAGVVEKDNAGRWRLKGEAARPIAPREDPRPTEPSPS